MGRSLNRIRVSPSLHVPQIRHRPVQRDVSLARLDLIGASCSGFLLPCWYHRLLQHVDVLLVVHQKPVIIDTVVLEQLL